MEINIVYGEESIHNLAFIKALLIKKYIDELDINNYQKEELRKQVLKEMKSLAMKEKQS